jgi:hypothetical protein
LPAGCCAVALWLAQANPAAGSVPGAPAALAGIPRPVEIVAAASETDLVALRSGIEALLPDVEMRWSLVAAIDSDEILHPAAPGALASARVFLDLGAPGMARIYLADGQAQRFAARRVEYVRLDEAATETIAQIVKAALDSLLDPAAPALSRAEIASQLAEPTPASVGAASTDATDGAPTSETAPVSAPLPPVAATTGSAGRFLALPWPLAAEVRAGYGARALQSSSAWAHGPGLGGVVGIGAGDVRPLVWLQVERSFSITTGDVAGVVDADLSLLGVRAGAGLAVGRPHEAHFVWFVGYGVDEIQVTPRPGTADVKPATVDNVIVPALRVGLALEVPLRGRFFGYAAGRLDASPRLRLTVDDPERRLAWSSSRLQAGLEAGVALGF